MSILVIIYIITAVLLAVYGLNAFVLTALFLKHRRNLPSSTPPLPGRGQEEFPAVTVQLPIYNEAMVVERLIDAIVRLNYPPQRLQIQVLDDSTDETTEIAQAKVAEYRRQGLEIELLHRTNRTGFKAGALKNGLKTATGHFIAIFDADFVPEPDFLQQTIPHLVASPQLGFVQTRWGHLNRDYSVLTATQALAIDGHFVVEQTARNRSGLLMGFNGTAGVWRRSCIESAGGWQGDTIAEDLDLSYRAQLGGWRCLFLPHVVAPAEVPPQLAAFKRQQFRWAKGSIQCLKKLGGPVWGASLPWPVKVQALIHLSNYLVHPLIVILALITPILMLAGSMENVHFPLIYLSLISFGPPLLYAASQIALNRRQWRHNYRVMPLLIFLGSGIALSNSRAVLEALLGLGGNVFKRTPKFNVTTSGDDWQDNPYRLPIDGLTLAELALSLYSFLGAGLAAINGNFFAVPFVLLYAVGFGYVGWQGWWENHYRGQFKAKRRNMPQSTFQRSTQHSTLERSNI